MPASTSGVAVAEHVDPRKAPGTAAHAKTREARACEHGSGGSQKHFAVYLVQGALLASDALSQLLDCLVETRGERGRVGGIKIHHVLLAGVGGILLDVGRDVHDGAVTEDAQRAGSASRQAESPRARDE